MPMCFSCNTPFADNKELALHITTTKDKKHRNRKSKVWAANYLNRTRALNSKRDLPGRTKLDEQDKENKRKCERDVSKLNVRVLTKCPQCKRVSEDLLNETYVKEDYHAWRDGDYFMRLCVNHRDSKYDFTD